MVKCPTCGAPTIKTIKRIRSDKTGSWIDKAFYQYSLPLQDQCDSYVMPPTDTDYD